MKHVVVAALALVVLAGPSPSASAPPVAGATCVDFCARSVDCMSAAMAREEGGRKLSGAERTTATAMCTRECEAGGDPPSVLGCMTARSCDEIVGAAFGRSKSPSADVCTPRGSAAIGKALSLGVRTGDACVDRCRHQHECQLAIDAKPTYERSKSALQSCVADCRQNPSPAGYDACVANLACTTHFPTGALGSAGAQECARRSNGQAASAGVAAAAGPTVAGRAARSAAGPSPRAGAAGLASAAAGSRVVYRAEKDIRSRLPWRQAPGAGYDQNPDDGWTWLSANANTLLHRGRPYPFGYSGAGQWPTISKRGFFDGYAVVEAEPGFVPPLAPEGSSPPRFMLLRGTERPVFLSPGVDAKSATIDGAVLVWTRGGDPQQDRWTAVYDISVREFDGVKRRLRVQTYGPDGAVRKTIEGPEFGFDLKFRVGGQPTIAFVDLKARALVLVSGQVWSIESGRTVGNIAGATKPSYVRATGEFYTVTLGRTARPWGVVDARSGDVVAGGSDGRELTLNRIMIEGGWRTRAVPLVSVVVPAPGMLVPQYVDDDWSARGPLDPLVLRLLSTYDVSRLDVDPKSLRTITATDSRYQQEAIFKIMPGRSGLVDVHVFARVPSHGVLLELALLADPKSPASPVPVGYELVDENASRSGRDLRSMAEAWAGWMRSRGSGAASDLAISPATADAASLGVWSRINGASFVYERSAGTISPLTEQPWTERASPIGAPQPGTAPAAAPPVGGRVPAGSPAASEPALSSSPGLEVVHLGPPVRSPMCEWEAFFEPATAALIFHREEWSPGGRSNRDLGWFRAQRTAEGWGSLASYPMPVGAMSPTLSPDGGSLYFGKVLRDAAGTANVDLFISRRAAGSWTEPQSLGPTVNSPHREAEPTLSRDGTLLVFSSDRPGGAGSDDLWAATRAPDGTWSAPRNMGRGVNSGAHEMGPRLSDDGRTLYFNVPDPPRSGIYMSTFDGERWGPRRHLSPLLPGASGLETSLVPVPGGREAMLTADKSAITGDCADLFLVRPASSPSVRTWRYDIRNVTGHWTGEIVLERVAGAWQGTMRGDQGGTSVALQNVRLSSQEMYFDAPAAAQTYRGRLLPDGRVVGTFTWSGRSWDWAAVETTKP